MIHVTLPYQDPRAAACLAHFAHYDQALISFLFFGMGGCVFIRLDMRPHQQAEHHVLYERGARVLSDDGGSNPASDDRQRWWRFWKSLHLLLAT